MWFTACYGLACAYTSCGIWLTEGYSPLDRAELVKLALANGVSQETVDAMLRGAIPSNLYSGGEQLPSPEFSLEELEEAEKIIAEKR